MIVMALIYLLAGSGSIILYFKDENNCWKGVHLIAGILCFARYVSLMP